MDGLDGRRVLVVGGTGEVGEGIVRNCLQAGAEVIVPARSAEKRDALLARHATDGGSLTALLADFSIPAQADALRDATLASGPIDAVVASIGGWRRGPALEAVSPDIWSDVFASSLHAHIAVAQTFVPVLRQRPGSSYILIVGAAADNPVPGSGPVCVAASAVKMLGRAYQAELGGGEPSFRLLQIETPVLTRSRPTGRPGWVSADGVGEATLAILDADAADITFLPPLRREQS